MTIKGAIEYRESIKKKEGRGNRFDISWLDQERRMERDTDKILIQTVWKITDMM